MTNIHPSAIVSPNARLGKNARIGPYSIIEDHVEIGDDCTIAARVSVKTGTRMGSQNVVHEGCVLGGASQHLNSHGSSGKLVIGDHNTIRENATMHLALDQADSTTVGSFNTVMVGAHLGHDAQVGNHCIIVNNALLGGHVILDDHAYLSGGVAVHQYCRVGTYAFVSGPARIIQDVPPYVTVDGSTSKVVGLNTIGLRRNGFEDRQIAELKAAYRLIFRGDLEWHELLTELHTTFPTGPASEFRNFIQSSQRGFLRERRRHNATTLRIFKPSVPDGASASPNQSTPPRHRAA